MATERKLKVSLTPDDVLFEKGKYATQGDKGTHILDFSFKDLGTITGKKLSIGYKRPDNTLIIQEATLANDTSHTLYIDDRALEVVGTLIIEVVIRESDNTVIFTGNRLVTYSVKETFAGGGTNPVDPEAVVFGLTEAKSELDGYSETTVKPALNVYRTEVVQPAIDLYRTGTVNPAIDLYRTGTINPAIDLYRTGTVNPAIDLYRTGTINPAIITYMNDTILPSINNYADDKKTEIATHADEEIARVTAETGVVLTIEKGASDGVAPLDSSGKIPSQYMPSIAISDTYVINTEAAMLALMAQRGDFAVRTDISKTFVLSTENPGTFADWIEILTAGYVTSVNGQTGSVLITHTSIGAEPSFAKNSGFNKNKTDLYNLDNSDTIATAKAIYDGLSTKEPVITKNSGFNKNKSDSVISTSSETVATSNAVKTAYDKGVEALGVANTKQPAGTYNTVIGTDTDIDTSGSTIIDNIYVTDGVITSMGTRVLTASDIGALPSTGLTSIVLNGVTITVEV